MAMSISWQEWWRARGEERLALVVWAAWNPIGSDQPGSWRSMRSNACTHRLRQMEIAPDPAADRNAAMTLIDWYSWETAQMDQ